MMCNTTEQRHPLSQLWTLQTNLVLIVRPDLQQMVNGSVKIGISGGVTLILHQVPAAAIEFDQCHFRTLQRQITIGLTQQQLDLGTGCLTWASGRNGWQQLLESLLITINRLIKTAAVL